MYFENFHTGANQQLWSIYLQIDLSKNAETQSKREEVKFNLNVSLVNYSATHKRHSFNSMIISDWTENELIALKRN